MDEQYIKDRITQLRMQKDVSEYQMSYDLGHSRAYINNISSGKSLPSVGELLAVCEYFGISPKEFFNEQLPNPGLLQHVESGLAELNEDDLRMVLGIISRLKKR